MTDEDQYGQHGFAVVLIDDSTHSLVADRMDVRDGCLLFFGPGDMGLTFAYGAGRWKRVGLVSALDGRAVALEHVAPPKQWQSPEGEDSPA